MDTIIAIVLVGQGIWWITTRIIASARRNEDCRRQFDQQQVALRQRQSAAQQQHSRVNRLYRELQLALMQMDDAPDFRRAASRAIAAREVPSSLRQRQYHRFRSCLVKQYHRRLKQEVDQEVLLESLTELVQALGVAAFEAEYIQHEAARRMTQRTAEHEPESFSTSLRRLQREHQERMVVLNTMTADAQIKEQLIEVEQRRFQEQMLRLTDTVSNTVLPCAETTI